MTPFHLAIHDLLAAVRGAAPDDRGGVIDTFLADHSAPINEGRNVTFLWRGEADRVQLLHWIFGLESSQPFTRIEGCDLWYAVVELRRNSRVEYKLLIERDVNGELQRELHHDPFNDNRAHDPFGSNSVVHTEGYEVPEWSQHDDETRPGVIEDRSIVSAAFGEVRPVRVYLPARYRETQRYPLLVVHDGSDYVRFSALATVLDNLIERLEIPPMVVALSDPGDRLTEYADDPRHATHIVEELVPALAALYPLQDRPGARGLMGASFGAVASLSTAWRHPGFFGRLLLQSGSFAFTDIGDHDRGAVFDPVVAFVNAFRSEPGKPANHAFLSCGVYERLIYENRSIVPLLQGTGMDVRFEEARDGHNWENWRDRLRIGLSWLFPGPLWMVYE